MSSPSPIPLHIISLTLEYLLPPTGPFPPHLISKALMQRHHFLTIDPTDSSSYFCWPRKDGSSTDTIIQALETLSTRRDTVDTVVRDIRYDTDGESLLLARVQLSTSPSQSGDGVQVIFHYDSEQGWRYHDTVPMPFPLSSCDTVEEVLAKMKDFSSSTLAEGSRDGSSTPASEAYWDGYASSSSSPQASDMKLPDQSGVDETAAEDSYWASYSNVHGTADSEVPSPFHPTHNLNRMQETSEFYTQEDQDEASVAPFGKSEGRILSVLPPPRIPSPESFGSMLEERLLEVSWNASPREPLEEVAEPEWSENRVVDDSEVTAPPEDDGLQDVIRGVYKLWRARRQPSPQFILSDDNDQAAFMRLVAQSLEGLQSN